MESAEKTAPLFVDVGGGLGLQCVAFKQAILKLVEGPFEGRLIHQDLPETLNQAPCHEGVEKMAQDFFKGQAVEGGVLSFSIEVGLLMTNEYHRRGYILHTQRATRSLG